LASPQSAWAPADGRFDGGKVSEEPKETGNRAVDPGGRRRGTGLAILAARGAQRPNSAQEAPLSTALIQVAVSGDAPASPLSRPRADFVAQLIAAKMQAPQTRPRRRAEPAEANAAYRMRDSRPASPGSALSCSL